MTAIYMYGEDILKSTIIGLIHYMG